MAYNPALTTDRDLLRFFMQDTNDAAPAFGLNEAGYDALIGRLGMTQAAIALIDQKLQSLGPEMVVDGDRTDMINRQYMFWETRKKQLISGEIQVGGIDSYDPGAVSPMALPDLSIYKEL